MWVPHFHELALTPLWKQKPQHFDAHSHKAPNFESASQNCLWSFYGINYQVINISTPIIASKHIQTHTHIYNISIYKLKPSGFVLDANHICIYVHLNIHSHRPLEFTRPPFPGFEALLHRGSVECNGAVQQGPREIRCWARALPFVLTAPQMMSSNSFFWGFFKGKKRNRKPYLVANYPRLVSGLVHPSYKWDFCRVNPHQSLGL